MEKLTQPIRIKLTARNIFQAACLIAILIALLLYWVEGRDLFGFVYLFSAWAGASSFCIVWSLLTLTDIFMGSQGMKAPSGLRAWAAIVTLCFGVTLAVKLGLEIFQ
jgi:hypothetical protein